MAFVMRATDRVKMINSQFHIPFIPNCVMLRQAQLNQEVSTPEMKAVCVKREKRGINSAANRHLLGLTLRLPTLSEHTWNNSRRAFDSHTYTLQQPFCQLRKTVRSRLYRGACIVDIFPPLISTRESWGQSDWRLMRGVRERERKRDGRGGK